MMKTFKLVSMKIARNDEYGRHYDEIPLKDGLVINKKDGENDWLLESLISREHLGRFQKLMTDNQEQTLVVTISKKTNTPAKLKAAVSKVVELENELISVLFSGKMAANRPFGNAEKILTELLDEGLDGEDLLQAFSAQLHKQQDQQTVSSK
ncbi:YwpF family protein [Bacillus sp. FJAT-42376]|uniref:YwpF family protein n=1 Tax=Bacillus sp. FJAT-42376 TaxID=2014076 RepID=UPI0013DE155A|nr:YwpF family protein [Bacillus sp. FJAT-42376]